MSPSTSRWALAIHWFAVMLHCALLGVIGSYTLVLPAPSCSYLLLPSPAPLASALEEMADSTALLLLLALPHARAHMLMQSPMPCRRSFPTTRFAPNPWQSKCASNKVGPCMEDIDAERGALCGCFSLCPWPHAGVISASTTHTLGRHHNTHRQIATGAQSVETGQHQVDDDDIK